ncbi:hypothetical protein FKP32DRAFT_1595196 [Trametes sanguinea]|nr:hypothetical protein FKP32DRAFT_1595196 [Trametes sanguinea]
MAQGCCVYRLLATSAPSRQRAIWPYRLMFARFAQRYSSSYNRDPFSVALLWLLFTCFRSSSNPFASRNSIWQSTVLSSLTGTVSLWLTRSVLMGSCGQAHDVPLTIAHQDDYS